MLLSYVTQPYVTETHVKPGVMEHLEQLSSQLTNAQKQFTAYKTRLNVLRTTKDQIHIEGKDVNFDCPDLILHLQG